MTASATIELRDIRKRFGAVVALRGVSLSVGPGEVVGLLGDNGAGKSTVMKILAGALTPDEGEILLEGVPTRFSGPRDARERGIEMVYQDLALCDDLDVASNFYLGREPRRMRLLRFERMHEETRRQLAELGVQLNSTRREIRTLSGGQRQAVAIGRAVSFTPRVLIMDEPTAALGVKEAALVQKLIRRVSAQGVAVILITHRLADVLEVCDRAVILYEGANAGAIDVPGMTLNDLVEELVAAGQAA
jgi:simple sugar transport system ATP-binding protein